MDFSLSIISAMRHQEETGYATGDFLHQHDPPSAPVGGPLNQSQSSPVSVECRNLMVSWCYQVVDYCRFRRETVEIAMSYLDRFCCTALGITARTDRKIYQLAAMTCLYTACKIHEPEAMDPKLVSNLSRGAYSPKEVEEMESMIVEALQWRLNPPTSLSFVRQLLDLIPLNVISQQIRQAAYDITKYQTELAVSEREFIQVKGSTIAYGALMNALESVGVDSKVLAQIGFAASQAIGISDHDDHIYQVQSWLYEAVIRQPSGGITMAPVPPKQSKASRRASMGEESPRTITDL
jgi:Cyclin, N-terminal domain